MPEAAPSKNIVKTDAQTTAERVQRIDGWKNALSMINVDGDKRLQSVAFVERFTQEMAETFWRSSDTAERMVEAQPTEMIREGWQIRIEEDTSIGEELDAQMEDLETSSKLLECLNYRRAFGGGAILVGADDGQNLEEPLNEERIKSIRYLTTLTPREVRPVIWYDRPSDPKFGEPSHWEVRRPKANKRSVTTDEQVVIHESRLIRFVGSYTSRRQLRMNNGWGDSIFNRVASVIRDFDMAYDGAALLLSDFGQAVFKMKGLTELLAANEDETVAKRAVLINMSRSIARAVMLDAESEEFERKATPLNGLPEILDRMAQRLAAAARMPVTILMGQSPAGLNATGASDIRWWYDHIRSDQRRTLLPRLNRLITLLLLAKDGPTNGKLPDNWEVVFRPLWQLSDLEKADVHLKQAQADKLNVEAQIVAPEEVAMSRYGRAGYSLETTIDVEAREAMLADDPIEEREEEPEPAPGAPGTGDPIPKGGSQTAPGNE